MRINRWFNRLPIAWRLNAIILLVGGTSVALVCAAFIVYDALSSRGALLRDLGALAELAATSGTDAVALASLLVIVLFGALWIALALSMRLQRVISQPLEDLTALARSVAVEHRHDLHGPQGTANELGDLVAGLNEMLDQIDRRDRQLQLQQIDLEGAVDARTAELLAVNEQLVAARDKAMDASRAKSAFLANMSHEILTPMNGIIGMTELMLDSELTTDQRDQLVTVRASAETLLAILNDILDFSKIESHRLELESTPFPPADLVSDVLRPLTLRAEEKGLELIAEIAPDVPPALVGDPHRLRQVLMHLVGNAIKFTERGHVAVAVSVETRSGDTAVLHFAVSDTGIGIPRQKQASIFEPFIQADGSSTRRFGGAGLGLTIARALADLMGGRLWVDSEPQGSTFHFTASFGAGDLPHPDRPDTLLLQPPVLVVDDNAVNRRIFVEALSRWQMKPTAVTGGREALDALLAAAQAGNPFALVLLDANMPDLDGFAVAERIRQEQTLAGATIMMLTSSGQYGDSTRCRELGVAAYLTKPIKPADLLQAIYRALERPGAAAVAARTEPGPAGSARRLRVLLVEDNPVNQRVAVGLLGRRGHAVVVAGNGREAILALERDTFDVVLMDVQMPELGGFEATGAIRAREGERGGHVRIVAMTAHAMPGDREHCLAAGMDDYLSKPVEPRALFAAVEHDATSSCDLAALERSLDGDQTLVREVVKVFLDDCPLQLAAIRTAVDERDPARIRTTAHTLRGAAGYLRAALVVEAAREVEEMGREKELEKAEAAYRRLAVEVARLLDDLRKLQEQPA